MIGKWYFMVPLFVLVVFGLTAAIDSSLFTGFLYVDDLFVSSGRSSFNSINDNVYYVVVNDSSDIQNKIDMCGGSCTIFIPKGVYELDSSINITGKLDLNIVGAGMYDTVFEGTALLGSDPYFYVDYSSRYIKISNLKIDGTSSYFGGEGIWIHGLLNPNYMYNPLVERVYITRVGGSSGILIGNAFDAIIRDNKIDKLGSNGKGIDARYLERFSIENNFIYAPEYDGIYCVHSCNKGTIYHNSIYNVGRYGIILEDDTTFHNDGSYGVVIDSNYIYNASEYAIILRRESKNNIVTNNFIQFVDDTYGIGVSGTNVTDFAVGNILASNNFRGVNNVVSRYVIDIISSASYNNSFHGNSFDYYPRIRNSGSGTIFFGNGIYDLYSTFKMSGFFGFGSSSGVVLSSGVVTLSKSYTKIDTEGGAASDDLDCLNGGSIGDVVIISSVASTRDVVVKDGVCIKLAGNADFTLDSNVDTLTLLRLDSGGWLELSRADIS